MRCDTIWHALPALRVLRILRALGVLRPLPAPAVKGFTAGAGNDLTYGATLACRARFLVVGVALMLLTCLVLFET